MKKKYICIVLIIITCLSIHIKVYGKYVFDQTFDAVQINVDRKRPAISIEQVQQKRTDELTQSVELFIKVFERNLGNDILSPNEVEVYVDNQKVETVTLSCIKQNSTDNNYFFKIDIGEIPIGENIQIKIKEGAFTDIVGWKSNESIETIKGNFLL